jgi:ComEC/Rec2-related protein
MIRSPLVAASFLFASGILCASAFRAPFLFFYGLSALLFVFALCFLKKPLAFGMAASCLIFLLGGAVLRNSQQVSRCHLSRFFPFQGSQIVKGYVTTPPDSDGSRSTFLFKAEAFKNLDSFCPCAGEILVRTKAKIGIGYGEEWILKGNLRRGYDRPGVFRAPGVPQNRFIMSVKSKADCVNLGRNRGSAFKRLALRIKRRFEGIILRSASGTTAGILQALVLGERKHVPRFLLKEMMKSGTIHVLVVSGFHVGLACFVMILFLKLLRLPRKVRCILTLMGLFLYVLVTGGSVPVVRAALMAAFLIFAALLKRESDIRHSFCLAFLFILSFNPAALFKIGFQLSFACVFSLVWLYPRLRLFLRVKSVSQKGLRFLLDALLTSFSCWLASAGFIAYYFKIFSPVTLLANVLIVPLAGLLALSGFILVGVGLFSAEGALVFGRTCDLLVWALVKLTAFLVHLPFACFYLS